MSDRRWYTDMIDLCEEQGFEVTPLMGGTGVWVEPPNAPPGTIPVCLYKSNSGARDLLNREAALKRLGVRIPSNHTPPKVRAAKQEQPMITSAPKPAVVTAVPINKFERVRQKINAALDALAEADAALTELEDSHKKLTVLHEALRGLSI